jgi:predicted RND superfamily exporter protein
MNDKTNGRFLRPYVTWITAHPRSVIAAVLLVTIVLASQLQYLHIVLDPDRQLPPEHPIVLLGNRITSIFGGKYVVVVGLEVREGDVYNPTTLAKVQRITAKLREVPGVIQSNVLSLSAINVKDIEGTAEGMKINRMMATVPQTPEALQVLKSRVARSTIARGLMVSDDGKMTTMIVDFASVDKAGGFSGIYERLEEIIAPEQDDNTTFHLAGLPINLHWMGVYSARMRYIFPVALLVIALLLYSAFRTGQGLAIPLCTAILSVLWSLGILGLTRLPLDPYNIMTPILILAVAAGHSVQILKRYYEEYNNSRNNREAVIESTTRIGAAMLTAGCVAAAGFASLVTFQTPSIRAFGSLTAFGILAALTIEMTFIPALRTLLKPPDRAHMLKESRRTVFDPFLEGVARWITGGKAGYIIAIFAIVLLVSVFGMTLIETNNSPSAFFSGGSAVIADLNAVNRNIAGAYVMQVLVEGESEDALKEPKALKAIESLQNYAATLSDVGKVVSLVDFMKMMNKAMNANDPAYDAIPESKELVAQYLLLYSMSGDPGDFDRVVDYGYQRTVMTLYVKKDLYAEVRQLQDALQGYIDTHLHDSGLSMHVGGGVLNVVALSEVIIHGKVYNILQICGIIFFFGSVVFVSFVGGFLVLLPLLISVIANLGVMGLAGVWLSIPTATISAMALGIGADYSIYFLFRVREEMGKGADWNAALAKAETTSGKAILFVASSIACGYLCLVLSGFLIHVYLGILVPLTMVVSSLGALTIMPATLLLIKPRFLRQPQTTEVSQ